VSPPPSVPPADDPPADPDAPLAREFFARGVLDVAPDLLGRVVHHETPEGVVAVRLTEVEAYAGEDDPGSHARRGRTPRNAVMFGPPGHVYVYFSYGMHWCMNLVCGPDGRAAAVLLRAGEVVAGEDLARARRALRPGRAARAPAAPGSLVRRDLARGPARLTRALGVDRARDGADACAPAAGLTVLAGTPADRGSIGCGPRTGVSGDGAHHPWRFHVQGEATVSPYRPASPRRRRMRDSGA
jgi:DNA-3-methyladenine glycosylase